MAEVNPCCNALDKECSRWCHSRSGQTIEILVLLVFINGTGLTSASVGTPRRRISRWVKRTWASIKRSKKLVSVLLDAISAGAPYNLACKAAGIHVDTFHGWRRDDPNFALQVEQVVARGALKRLKKIEQHGEDNFTALSWMLERRYPEMFSKPEVQLNGIQNNVNGNDKKNFEIVVVEDLEFLGLRQRSEYTHHPDGEPPVREVETSNVEPPRLHLNSADI